ncbi:MULTISPECIES: hypothetical protein [unclassified Paenibacillus]|uniref:hypothetical protein n=1 Tax=unclassified Paenibacillus TaxID=185978 RepID=UPI001C1080D0|nr:MULTISPECIES: hypothetical protein [unclassified Paenibacillus]MBU5444781.1 hypothetical protein [Paenibacillus sp. MSJ-34]CAH0119357.1 hypothetical protein PAE9249_01857 [Paenibacillus sp. CECT 9249]
METNVNVQAPHASYSTGVETAPVVSTKDWIVTMLLLIIPIVNIIMLFVWAFGGNTNPNKRNYSRAALIWALIGVAIYVIFFVLIFGAVLSSFA